MTTNEINIAIAQACGWRAVSEYRVGRSGNQRVLFKGGNPLTSRLEEIPNYAESLDAMHEAEKTLADEEWIMYNVFLTHALVTHALAHKRLFAEVGAKAELRAQCFLKTKGLWRD